MAVASLPLNETSRLQALREYSVMHTAPEREFDEIVSIAAQVCGTSRALIGFLDSSQEWLKSAIGFACGASPREDSMCQHVIAVEEPVLEVEDASLDLRFKDLPSVLGEPHIRFYAGVQVRAPGGEAVGTLCVVDFKPRRLDEAQRRCLLALARQVTSLLELRRSVVRLQVAMDEQRWYVERMEAYQKQLETANIQLEQQSASDGLTGLSNRRSFEKRLEDEASRSRRHGHPLSLLLLDADHFKSYNDSYGHPAGDEVLRTFGRILRDSSRASDTPARYGGEEFAVILPQTGPEGAHIIAERIRRAVEAAPWPHRPVTVSIGVSTLAGPDCLEKPLLDAADHSLYQAKHAGRNRVGAPDRT